MKLVGTLRDCWNFWCIRLGLAQTGTIMLWCVFPWPSVTVDNLFKGIVFVQNVLIVVSRVIKQQPVTSADLQPPAKP